MGGYSVIVYSNHATAPVTGDFTIGATTIQLLDTAIFAGTYAQGNASAGNYVRFDNLSGSTFTLSALGDAGSLKAPVNAIQIISNGNTVTVAAPTILPNGGSDQPQ